MRQTEVQLDGQIGLLLTSSFGRFGGRLSEELPVGVTSESMLGEGRGDVVLRRGAEDLEIGSRWLCQLVALVASKGEKTREHTGKTSGIPPRIGLEPSKWAFSLTKSCS